MVPRRLAGTCLQGWFNYVRLYALAEEEKEMNSFVYNGRPFYWKWMRMDWRKTMAMLAGYQDV